MKTILLVLAAAAMLSACSPTTLSTTFNPNEAAYIQQTGKNTISGQAFLRRNDGIVVYAAGSEVFLVPVTAYSRERFASIYGTGKYAMWHAGFTSTDPAYQQYMRKTVANGEGRFSFEGVADGNYYIQTQVTWLVGGAQQGGSLMYPVTIAGGKAVEVIINGV